MKGALIVLAALGLLGGCASGRGRGENAERLDRLLGEDRANPSEVIAAELAFARTAQEKGQWAAFREFAADEAVMFTPQRVNAQAWLKGRAEPAVPVAWQPTSVWTSCDGSYAVTRGPWQRPNSVGYFTTVWQRQRSGSYKWVLDQGDALSEPEAVPEMIAAQVADCSKPEALVVFPAAQGVDRITGRSDDGTLQWQMDVRPDGSRSFRVRRWTGSTFEQVIDSQVAAGE